jgi:prophage regulatory protein
MQTIIRRAEVEKRTGYKTSTLYEKISKCQFPKPVKLGPRAVGWIEEEVGEHIARLIAKRDELKEIQQHHKINHRHAVSPANGETE